MAKVGGREEWGGTLLGAVVLAGVALSLVSARLTLAAVLALIAAIVATVARRGDWRQLMPSPGPVTVAVVAFLAYILTSTLWAAAGSKAVSKLLLVTVIGLSALVIAQRAAELGQETARRVAHGLLIGFAAGMAFLLIEVLSGQAIQIGVYNLLHGLGVAKDAFQPERHFTWEGPRLVAIEPAHINRNIAVAAALAFPAALAGYASTQGAWRWPVVLALLAAAVICALSSRHESSMVALLAGIAIFGLALLSARWSGRLLAAGWIAACLLVLPAVLLAHRAELHKTPWLHHSLVHRIVIWNTTAEETMKSPVLGIGAYMTYLLMPERNKTAEREEGVEYKKTFSRHAHNVYLQTWFELGAVGAALLAALGLAVIGAIRRLASPAQPFALAAFAASASLMSASYGMWQTWYVALFALSAIAVAGAARAAFGSQSIAVNPLPKGDGAAE